MADGGSKYRTQQETAMDVYPVRMTAAHARIARKLGGGNMAEGVRLALEKAGEMSPAERRQGPPERRGLKRQA